MSKPIVVAMAITGSVPGKKDNPAVPVTVDEQIASIKAAFFAGATLAHIHVRNDDVSPSSDAGRFVAVQDGLRRKCPGMIVQFSTGGRGRDPSQRGLSLAHRPDMASLSTGSVNFPSIVLQEPYGTRNRPRDPDEDVRDTAGVRDLRSFSHPWSPSPRRCPSSRQAAPRAVRSRRRKRHAGARASARHSSGRDAECSSSRNVDGSRNRTQPSDGRGMGACQGRRCGSHRSRGQHPDYKESSGLQQCRFGRPRVGDGEASWILRSDALGSQDRPRHRGQHHVNPSLTSARPPNSGEARRETCRCALKSISVRQRRRTLRVRRNRKLSRHLQGGILIRLPVPTGPAGARTRSRALDDFAYDICSLFVAETAAATGLTKQSYPAGMENRLY